MFDVVSLVGSPTDLIALVLILEARVRTLRDVRLRLEAVERGTAASARAIDGVRDGLVERDLSVDPSDVDPLVEDPSVRADGGISKRLDQFFSARGFATVVAGLGATKVVEVGITTLPTDPLVRAAAWFLVFATGVAMIAAWPLLERRLWGDP